MRALFRRGRHHVRTAPRPDDGGLVTVDTIAARIRREQFWAFREQEWAKRGSVTIRIVPDVRPFDLRAVNALEQWSAQMARAKSEGLGVLAL